MPNLQRSVCPACGAPYPNQDKPGECPFCGTQFILLGEGPDKDGTTLAKEAIAAFRELRYAEAISLFPKAIDKGSTTFDTATLYTMLGNTYDKLNRYEDAIDAHKTAIKHNPQSHKSWSNLGIVYRHLGDYREAAACYQKALTIEPNYPELHINLGALYIHQDKPKQAVQALRRGLKLDPAHAISHANLALALAMLGRFAQAEKALKTSIVRGYRNHKIIAERIKALKAFS